MITKTWYDPCPRCDGEVAAFDFEPEYVVSNPDSVIAFPNPDCPHLGDPEADCTCTVMINPAPDPMLDTHIAVGANFTMHPCGDVIRAGRGGLPGWHMYQQLTPEPGSLGELMQEWAAGETT